MPVNVNIIADQSIMKLADHLNELIDEFFKEYLSPEAKGIYFYKLNISIRKYLGKKGFSAGTCKVEKIAFETPKIKLYEQGLKANYHKFKTIGWNRREFDLFVLFHELGHAIHQLNHVSEMLILCADGNLHRISDPRIEDYCNRIAQEYLKKTGLLKAQELSFDSNYYNSIGFDCNSKMKHERAVVWFDMAIELDQTNSEIWWNKGFALWNLERFEEAIQCMDKALSFADLSGTKSLEYLLLLVTRGNSYFKLEHML